jgi:hypothetical protein
VLKQGSIGVRHWASHIQAQRDNLDGKISVEQMKAQFKKTRLKGPGDLKRYSDSLATYGEIKGSCAKVTNADRVVAAGLAKCQKRSKAQKPVMEAIRRRHEGLEESSKADAGEQGSSGGQPIAGTVCLAEAVPRGAQEHQCVQEGNCQVQSTCLLTDVPARSNRSWSRRTCRELTASHDGVPSETVGVDL